MAKNPAELVTPPRIVQREMTVRDPEEVRGFFDAVADDRLVAT